MGTRLIRRGAPRRFVAWLAIAAVWLLVAAPTISRSLPSAWSWPDLGAWCTGHGLSDQHPSAPGDPALHLDQCGYCALLAHDPLLAGGTLAVPLAAGLSAPAPVTHAEPYWRALPLLSAHPRGPPSILIG